MENIELSEKRKRIILLEDEIKFCKQMHQLRPQQWELDFAKIKKLIIN